jgi:hypothetical protein
MGYVADVPLKIPYYLNQHSCDLAQTIWKNKKRVKGGKNLFLEKALLTCLTLVYMGWSFF